MRSAFGLWSYGVRIGSLAKNVVGPGSGCARSMAMVSSRSVPFNRSCVLPILSRLSLLMERYCCLAVIPDNSGDMPKAMSSKRHCFWEPMRATIRLVVTRPILLLAPMGIMRGTWHGRVAHVGFIIRQQALPPLDSAPLLVLVSLAGRGGLVPSHCNAFRRTSSFPYELPGTGHWREGRQ